MFNGVKSFSKIQLQDNNNRLLGCMTLMKIFKSLGNTILNGSGFQKTILMFVNAIQNPPLYSVCHQFSEKFQTHIGQRDGPVIILALLVRNRMPHHGTGPCAPSLHFRFNLFRDHQERGGDVSP
jgi:hypothetical protein